jgi:hypothetical protein
MAGPVGFVQLFGLMSDIRDLETRRIATLRQIVKSDAAAAIKSNKTKHILAPAKARLSSSPYEELAMSIETICPKKILVFLPQAAADVIVTKLAEHGHECVAVSTVPEAFNALRSNSCSFAITTRPEIDLLRNIRSIPVVNLEVFFHAEPSGDGPLITSKRFDGSAFMKRIEFLVQPTATRAEPAGVEQANEGMRGRRAPRWWTAVKVMLGLPRQREGLRDVRS